MPVIISLDAEHQPGSQDLLSEILEKFLFFEPDFR